MRDTICNILFDGELTAIHSAFRPNANGKINWERLSRLMPVITPYSRDPESWRGAGARKRLVSNS